MTKQLHRTFLTTQYFTTTPLSMSRLLSTISSQDVGEKKYKKNYPLRNANGQLSSTSHFWHVNQSQSEIAGRNKEAVKIIRSYLHAPISPLPGSPKSQLSSIIMSEPYFSSTSAKQTIELFYYMPTSSKRGNRVIDFYQFSPTNIRLLASRVSHLYLKETNILFTRVHYPYMNSSIFAQYLGKNTSANTFLHFMNAIFKYTSWHGRHLPSHIRGIKVQVSGRLITERAIPRITTKSIVFGSLNDNALIDYSKYTTKNSLGSFTIKV